MSKRTIFALGSLSAFLAIGAGAFGAHALQERVEPGLVELFETAARYQLAHALGLLGIAIAADRWSDPLWTVVAWAFVLGTVLFSGSLYALGLGGVRWLGAITPLGGMCFLTGWITAIVAAWRSIG